MTESILFVDDEKNVLESIRRTMHKLPYECEFVNSAEEALGKLREKEYALMVTDKNMPSINGMDLLAVVRQRYPNMVRMMLSGDPSVEACLRAVNEGEVFRFLVKPCAAVDLKQSVAMAIQHRRLLSIANNLFKRCKQRERDLRLIEKEFPDIMHVERDADGAICLDEELPSNFDDYLQNEN